MFVGLVVVSCMQLKWINDMGGMTNVTGCWLEVLIKGSIIYCAGKVLR